MSDLKKKKWAVISAKRVIVKLCTYNAAWNILVRESKTLLASEASGLCVVTNDVAIRLESNVRINT